MTRLAMMKERMISVSRQDAPKRHRVLLPADRDDHPRHSCADDGLDLQKLIETPFSLLTAIAGLAVTAEGRIGAARGIIDMNWPARNCRATVRILSLSSPEI